MYTYAYCSYKTKNKKSLSAPRGGTTDVGMHTGSRTRHTIWPIVEAVIENLMVDDYDYLRFHFDLWILDNQLNILEKNNKSFLISFPMINAVFKILTTASQKIILIPEVSFEQLQSAKNSLNGLKNRITKLSTDSANHLANQYKILPTFPNEFIPNIEPQLCIINAVVPSLSGLTTEKLSQIARINLEVIPLSDDTMNWKISDISNLDYKGLHHIMTYVENKLTDEAINRLKNSSSNPYVTAYSNLIEKYINFYEAAIKKDSSANQTSLMTIELHSQELLMKWTAFCLMHKYITSNYPCLSRYGVPLKSSNLQHLVLSNKRHLETMVIVASYLDKNTKHGQEIFSLLPTDQTFNMINSSWESINPSLSLMWDNEKSNAERRIVDHWKIITDKKDKCNKLRNSIAKLKSTETSLRASLHGLYIYNVRYSSISDDIDRTVEDLKKLEIALQVANTPPPPVLQPLPERKDLAFPLLFFHYIPEDFRVFSIMNLIAQEMLIPKRLQYSQLYEACKFIYLKLEIFQNNSFYVFYSSWYHYEARGEYYHCARIQNKSR